MGLLETMIQLYVLGTKEKKTEEQQDEKGSLPGKRQRERVQRKWEKKVRLPGV
jgi:hypothetical protein